MRSNTDWLHASRFGLLAHFLADLPGSPDAPALSPEEWNRRVDAFDVHALAEQAASVGAGYFVLTVGQNSGYYCSPNASYDALVGRSPSRLSRRDLVGDLADALVPRGLRTMAYVTRDPPANDALARERLQYGRERSYDAHGPLDAPWAAVLRDWSARWNRRVAGWWVDGVYSTEPVYREPDVSIFELLTPALKAANPDAVIAFNPGVKVPRVISPAGSNEDFTAGEVDFALPVAGRWYDGAPAWPGRFVEGAQFHILTFLGEWWGAGDPRFPEELVVGYTKHVNAHGGAVTWDVPLTPAGTIPDAFMSQLATLRGRRS